MYFRHDSMSQATFVIKISLVALDKSHETLVANDKGY
jgi:hypothetical protein